jgi:hypothetical protein
MVGAFELAQEQRKPEQVAAMPKNSSVIVLNFSPFRMSLEP